MLRSQEQRSQGKGPALPPNCSRTEITADAALPVRDSQASTRPSPSTLAQFSAQGSLRCVVFTSPLRSCEQCLLGRTQALDGTPAINAILVLTLYSTEGKLEGTGGGMDAASPLISPQTFLRRKLG